MATSHLLSTDAGFKYDPGSGVVTHKLALAIFIRGAGSRRWRAAADSVDGVNREVTTMGSDLDTLTFTIRLDNEPGPLLAMLNAAADGKTLTYYPSLADSGTNYAMALVSPEGQQLRLQPDRDRFDSHGEYEVTVTVRETTDSLTPLM